MLRHLPLIIVALAGCSESRSTIDAAADAATDSPMDAADADGSSDTGPAPDAGPLGCADLLEDRLVALDESMVLGQIHPAAAWDGEGIWVVYSRPDDAGLFDTYATRRGCDGAALVEPFSVSSAPAFGNDIDPELAIAGDRMLIAWNTDDGVGPNNLSVRYRVFGLDGTPVGDDRTLETTHMGAAVTGNQLGASVAGTPSGGFVIAGGRGGVAGVTAFSAYTQPLTRDGAPDGATLEPMINADASQTATAVDVDTDGTVWVAYTESIVEPASEHLMVRSFAAAAPEVGVEGLLSSAGASVLAADGAVWVAFSGLIASEINLRLVDATVPLASRTAAVWGDRGRIESAVRLAVAPDGALAAVWFRNVSGFTNEIYAARFSAGNPPTVAAPMRVDPGTAPAYQPALTHVEGDYWFMAFAEGESPNFRLTGRFMTLAAE
ncbi:MAG: hypothetical protein JRH11_06825 [Deltaproteobacteria bacterium]|nr:hypothetical protein [Deltaproteobacteria bacterium]